ncbi:thioesterase II family protein [Longimicrobium sp.]|uniref:thioesterase II family protein n=1 Tax=Longimicrobium sp. TaxID=2029185 RepID=UPI002EDB211A
MSTSTTDRWIVRPKANPRARLRLFCIAHAGGGASAFRGWAEALPPEVEVCPVQLPGRENRFTEKPFDRLDPLVAALADAVHPWLDLPWALFGHSNGALIGFELARMLRARGLSGPRHLFASGRRAPDVPAQDPPIGHLPDDEFLADLGELGGLPRELLENREIMQILLPVLRADVALHETFEFREEAPLDCPITAYGGVADAKATREVIEAWGRHTRGPFVMRMFPGGHFFHQSEREGFLRVFSADLHPVLHAL